VRPDSLSCGATLPTSVSLSCPEPLPCGMPVSCS
jgi:hypothetical protein